MKRFLGWIIGSSLGIAILLAVPFIFQHDALAQSKNNFVIQSYDIQYELSRNDEKRSMLRTVETITADFKVANQNHGLERALVTKYNGHPTRLEIESVTDGSGKSLNYSTSTSNGVEVLRIGDPDLYVEGLQTYQIQYTQQDVTRYYQDTNRDEWYWDTNGTEWRVPIESLKVSAKFDEPLLGVMQGDPFCYQGAEGSTDKCVFQQASRGEYAATVNQLQRGENVTIAFGFAEGTFAPYEPTLVERILMIWGILTAITGLVGFVVLVAMIIAYTRKRNRTAEIHTIPVQYIPPKHTSLFVAGQVVTPHGSVFSAQLIDLAVRRVIQIIEKSPAKFFSLAQYDIKMLVDASTQPAEVQEILSDMWGSLPKAGDQLSLSSLRNDSKYLSRTLDNDKKMTKLIEGEYAIREKSVPVSKFFYRCAIVLLIFGVITVSIPLLVFAGITALLGYTIRPLTNKGLELRGYLLGLDRYIKAAEAERLKFFQAPDTAEKIGEAANVDDPGQILKLYERVLPYAILFGHERKWTQQLGEYYSTTQSNPSWYSGSTAFNAAVFSSAMSSFSSAAAYSGGSSSSSGGSSGGGSSGGGGGGGGGGGW